MRTTTATGRRQAATIVKSCYCTSKPLWAHRLALRAGRRCTPWPPATWPQPAAWSRSGSTSRAAGRRARTKEKERRAERWKQWGGTAFRIWLSVKGGFSVGTRRSGSSPPERECAAFGCP
ncbi:hypothetical protein AXF42_Ash008428 [Apostasia shenzhenica]|uniref:Uncharacterized protein n=1 Tax=Apostasia shenzhenica TaxID=1088818 RepID=A0A2I0AXW6_9ASPA|nr:hypothetical protein AXF42_Ash008428 [Apostasia shenzhenica]